MVGAKLSFVNSDSITIDTLFLSSNKIDSTSYWSVNFGKYYLRKLFYTLILLSIKKKK
ncbi:unnamed protein product [marine sediment metagenome]|uniref:Uncharacterized protein n=1 Tax=marine sediment metagenome TaxID=412755 RepID=X1ETT0_9ZZZZ